MRQLGIEIKGHPIGHCLASISQDKERALTIKVSVPKVGQASSNTALMVGSLVIPVLLLLSHLDTFFALHNTFDISPGSLSRLSPLLC